MRNYLPTYTAWILIRAIYTTGVLHAKQHDTRVIQEKTMETIMDEQFKTHTNHYIFVDKDIMQKSAYQKNLTVYENQILVVTFYTL